MAAISLCATRREIPDYLNVILNPMDLGTIAARLSRENYYVGPAAASLFISDVRLVFANCKEFNTAESDIWLIADDLSKSFEKWIYDWILCPSAWLKLEPTLDKEADKQLADEFRDDGEDSYDLWSPWETGCTICRKNDNSEQLLLCDRCDGEIHMYCSTPEITELPADEWFCAFCEVRTEFEKKAGSIKEEQAKQSEAKLSQSEVTEAAADGDEKKPSASPKKATVPSASSAIPSILREAVGVEGKKYNRKSAVAGSASSGHSATAKLENGSAKPNDRATVFLVKWLGVSVKYSTWERPEDIGDDEQIQRYFKFSRIPTQKEIMETTCQLPCCAKRNQYLLNTGIQKCCDKDRFCTLGWRHEGDCSREIRALEKAYGTKEYLKLRMVEQVKAQLYAFHCLLNNHTPDRDVLKQCGVFTNAYVCKKQYLVGTAKNANEEEDEDYSEDENAESSDEEYDDDEIPPFRPQMYPGLIEADDDEDEDTFSSKKKPEEEVSEVLGSIVEHVAFGYPTELVPTPSKEKYSSRFQPTSFNGLSTFSEYCVALRRTQFGLGMRLGVADNENASVLGFQNLPDGSIGPAEASQVISVGDVLVGVNNLYVGGLAFKEVIAVIGRSSNVVLFHFHSRRAAVMYPPYCQARQATLQRDNALEDAASESDFITYSYNRYKPMLKVGSTPASSLSEASNALVNQSNYISPNGPMQHLYAGIIDNSIDPHEHFASFLPARRMKDSNQGSGGGNEKTEFIPYEQSPTYKGGRTLRAYQVEGLNWMISCFKAQRSSILADEMGLGKTVQVVSFIEHLRTEESIRGPYLIVVPLSTIQHWRREIESWTDLNVCVYHDVGDRSSRFTAKDMRGIIRDQEWYYPGLGNSIFKFNILLTTFETLLADFEEMEQIHWRLIVVDEAHRLKSSGSRVLKQMRTFRCDRKLLLTGTPLQNNIQELWVLLNYLEPVKFGNMDEFNASFGKLISQEQVEKLQKLLGPYILRRVKEDVEKSIPPKEETIIAVELTTLQKQYYRAIYDKNKSFLFRGTKNALPTLNNIQLQLRMCCNHPFLIKGVEDRELEELGNHPSPAEVMDKVVQCSGKMVLVSKLLPKLKTEGHKVLIFSQFLKQLDMLERYCEYSGFGYERLDGSTSGSVRQNSIDRFSRPNSKSFVFLLSTKAGGVGINLIAADTVIIFDSDWNPMNDLQAQSRCHRIGQKKSVQIYRLVTRNTYESEMFDRASRKLGLEHAILGTASFSETAQVEKPSSEQLVELLKRGAYALMEEDDTASKEFADRDIETILKENAHVRVMDQNKSEKDGEDGGGDAAAVVPSHQRKSPAKKRVRKSLGGMAVDRSSFIAEGSTGDLSVDDPNFWEKVLPGAVSVEMLIMKLDDGSAVNSRQSKIKFISNLDIALTELVNEMKNGNDDDSRFGANFAHEYDIAIQILHAVTTKYKKDFSSDQLDLVKSYLTKLEKSRVRSCRVAPAKRDAEHGGTPGKKRRSKAGNYDSEDDELSPDDDDEEADATKGPSKKKGKRGRPSKKEASGNSKEKTLSSPARGKAGSRKKRKVSHAEEPAPILFEGGVINDSDDLCTLCGDGGLILLCDGPCHRSFHLECIGMQTEPDDDHWLCPDCSAGRHMCLICKQVGEMGVEFGVIQCSMAKCGRFYHKGCLAKHPRVEWVGKKRFRCPSHCCHGCSADEQKKASKKPVNVVSCIHCSQAFHPHCMASTEQFMRLSTNLMICATHLREKKSLTPVKSGSESAAPIRNGNGVAEQGGTSQAKSTSNAQTNGPDHVDEAEREDEDDGGEVASTPGKRKRVSIPSAKICGFCHRGDVVAESLVATEEAPLSKSRRASRSPMKKANGTAEVPPPASIEGSFVEAPVRLQLQDKSTEMVFVHLNCALHSPEVYVKTNGVFCNLPRALKRGRQLKCSKCKETGATVGCVVAKCRCNYHLRCAIESGGEFIGSPYSLYCKDHAAEKHAEPKTYCVCGTDDPADASLSLQCATCDLRYHPKCVNMSGRQAARKAKENWVCNSCAEMKRVRVRSAAHLHVDSEISGLELTYAAFIFVSCRAQANPRSRCHRQQLPEKLVRPRNTTCRQHRRMKRQRRE